MISFQSMGGGETDRRTGGAGVTSQSSCAGRPHARPLGHAPAKYEMVVESQVTIDSPLSGNARSCPPHTRSFDQPHVHIH